MAPSLNLVCVVMPLQQNDRSNEDGGMMEDGNWSYSSGLAVDRGGTLVVLVVVAGVDYCMSCGENMLTVLYLLDGKSDIVLGGYGVRWW
jgi:hypothetical protein